MVKQRGSSQLILLLVLVLIVFVGFYYFRTSSKNSQQSTTSTPTIQPTQKDETAEWKELNDKEDKISLKYPSAWKVSDVNNDRFCLSDLDKNNKQVAKLCVEFQQGNLDTIKKNLRNFLNSQLGSDINKYSEENLQVNGLNAVRAEFVLGKENAETEQDIWTLIDTKTVSNKTLFITLGSTGKNGVITQEERSIYNTLVNSLKTTK